MISLSTLCWIIVAIFVLIGAIRGMAKELIVSVSGIFAIFIITILLPMTNSNLEGTSLFWVRFSILIASAFFGYQTPNFRLIAESGKMVRHPTRDILFGSIIGGINGFIFFSSIWYFMAEANYPFEQITAPNPASDTGLAALEILSRAAPIVLTAPKIYYAMAGAMGILLVVLI